MKANFADNLKKIRKERGLSQEELADKLGVSRQSISKWESSQAYPEMDKVLQLCNIFNVTVDELLNQDIKAVRDKQESNNRVNKYIDDFLGFITKSIDMFSAMTFKEKIKCLFEQLVIILILMFVYVLLSGVLGWIVSGIFGVLPSSIYSVISRVFEIIYYVIYLIFGFVIFIHVFKTRYLDYYEVVREENSETNMPNNEKVDDEMPKEKDNRKIIIRDPKHSEYRFINALFKILLFIVKCFAGFIFVMLSIFLIFLVFDTVFFIYHIFVHSIFIGLSICGIAGIILTTLVLLLLFRFIFNKENNLKRIFVTFIISLILGGIGFASTFISFINMEYKDISYKNTDALVKTYEYEEGFNVASFLNDYTFIADNSLGNEVRFEVKYNKDVGVIKISKNGSNVSLHYDNSEDNIFVFYKKMIAGLKKNIIYNYYEEEPNAVIVASEDNIKKIISTMSDGNITKFSKDGNKYYLSIDYDYDGKTVCYLEDDYYHKCISVDLDDDDDDILDFSYDRDGFHYDHNKYICEGNNNKYCYEKDDD